VDCSKRLRYCSRNLSPSENTISSCVTKAEQAINDTVNVVKTKAKQAEQVVTRSVNNGASNTQKFLAAAAQRTAEAVRKGCQRRLEIW
jgi:hypothetical protein